MTVGSAKSGLQKSEAGKFAALNRGPGRSLLRDHPNAFVIAPALFLLAGQALAAVSDELVPAALLIVGIAILAFVVAARNWRWGLLALFCVGALLTGYWMHDAALRPTLPARHLRTASQAAEPLYLEAVHYREPERLPDRSRWYLRAERIWLPQGSQETEARILVTVGVDKAEWRYGDRVRLWLRVRPPRNFGNPGSFDYESYLARRNIYLTAYLETDAGVGLLHRDSVGLWGWVESLRREIGRFFDRHLPSEDAALMKALVVGDMGGITRELRDQSAAAGVAHVLSISGLHVGMLGVVVFFLVRFVGSFSTTLMLRWNLLKIATFFSFLAVLFYTCIAGAMVPTVRSAIMIAVYEFAVLLDREEEVFSSLALAALIIGLLWPGVVADISFQLSFLAILGIVWGMRKVQEWWPAHRSAQHPEEKNWLRPRVRRLAFFLAVPVLATVATGPMIAHHFGHLSLAGFLSNPVIVPLVGFGVVPAGLAAGFFALVAPAAARWLLFAAQPLLWLNEALVSFFASLPLASISVPIPNIAEVGLLYVVLLTVMAVKTRRQFACACAIFLLGSISWGYYWWRERWQRSELRITHLSVGQGDAAVVEFPGRKVLILDAGGTAGAEFDPGESIVAPFLRARKIRDVDYLVLAHPRIDHYGGMKSIVQQFSPREFWSGSRGSESAAYHDLEETLARSNVKRRVLNGRDSCRNIEDVEVCVTGGANQADPESSLVVRLTYRGASFLFAGDIGAREEKSLLRQRAPLRSTVIKVPRHGSANSSTEEFVSAVEPRLAIISLGERNPFGFPRAEVLARYRRAGAEILRTDEDGAVIVITDGKKLTYQTFRSGRRGSLFLDAIS